MDNPKSQIQNRKLLAPIELGGVTKTFGDVKALDNASFTIAEGERACLLGPNGAGKTTIIRLLTGALQPTAVVAKIYGAAARNELSPGQAARRDRAAGARHVSRYDGARVSRRCTAVVWPRHHRRGGRSVRTRSVR